MKFELQNPTRIVFGEGTIRALDGLVPLEARILFLFGGGSIKRNGVYDQVKEALGERRLIEFGGVEVNPRHETILGAAKAAREFRADLVLAVGGGSVIDAGKYLAYVSTCEEDDPWDRLIRKDFPERTLSVGAVLTLPATGSESNPVSVISSTSRGLKYPFSNEAARPAFAIMDPSTMATLDRRQLANGAVDAVTHVLEQYLVRAGNTPLQFGYAEALLEVLFEWGPKLLEENTPEARENVMWAANQALNGLIGAGLTTDWATHYIGHAITALYDVDHARSLTMVMPTLLRFKRDDKLPMLARYARRVWKVEEDDDRKAADRGILLTEDFFRRMDMPVRIGGIRALSIPAVVAHIVQAGQMPLGERRDIGPAEVRAILERAA
jgi:NADP-dependent alcohol dehydrogenase